MRIVFMRHARAQSQVDSTRIAGRSHGAPLTEDGRRHADKLAWEAQDLRFSSLHVSSCRRTLETAAPLADALALTAQPTDPARRHRPVRAVRGVDPAEPVLGGGHKHGSRGPWTVALRQSGVDEVLLHLAVKSAHGAVGPRGMGQ